MDFVKLKELSEAATLGEWKARRPSGGAWSIWTALGSKLATVFAPDKAPIHGRGANQANVELIVFLRNSVPAILALKEENEFLKKALGQAVSQGVPPQIPTLSTKDIVTMFSEDEEASVRDWEKYLQQAIPFGDDTVEFFSADECSYPANCPELAAYLKGQTEVGG